MLADLITELPLDYNQLYGQIMVTLREAMKDEKANCIQIVRSYGTGLSARIVDAILLDDVESSGRFNSRYNPFRKIDK